MIKRTLAYAIAISSFLILASSWLTSRSAAEPISGGLPGRRRRRPRGSRNSQRRMTEAETQFRKGDFAGALKALQEVVKKDPDQPPVQVLMAQMLSQAKMVGEMRGALEQAVIEAPTDPEAYMLMGDLALGEHRITEAQLLYQKANDLVGEFNKSTKRKAILRLRIFRGLAETAMRRKDWAGAQKYLEAWLKLDPKSVGAMQMLAQCFFKQKNVTGALEKLKEAAKVDPELITPEAILAQYYERAGDRENAKKWMIAALTAAPKDLRTRLAAGRWALRAGTPRLRRLGRRRLADRIPRVWAPRFCVAWWRFSKRITSPPSGTSSWPACSHRVILSPATICAGPDPTRG